jgi:hypothetical protein
MGKHIGRRPTVTNDAAKIRAIQADHKTGKKVFGKLARRTGSVT